MHLAVTSRTRPDALVVSVRWFMGFVQEHPTARLLPEGRVWVAPQTGRVLRTEFQLVSSGAEAVIAVDYKEDEALGLLVPVRMTEAYSLGRAGAGSTLEVRDAQLSLTRAELSLLENRIDVEVARYALERAAGRLGSGEGT